jgi:colanic acid/amylovoran biosynthesis glycosyltransferase
MSILFVMPDWQAASELWMQRMIEALEPNLFAIAARNPTEPYWQGRVRSIDLADPPPAFWRQICRRICLPGYLIPCRTAETALREAVQDPAVTAVLIHYAEFALRYWNVWANTEKKIFVHCHGYDVTWDLRSHGNPEEAMLPPDYCERVRALAARTTLIANSVATANKLKEFGLPLTARIMIKPYGVPVPETPPEKIRSSSSVNILYLGRLVDFKGPELVIRAFDLACQRGLDGTLTMAGDGPLRVTCELLRRESAFRDRIKMLGVVSSRQGESLRSEADIFTAHNRMGPLSRQEEAFGVSIIEAMAAAIPVVTGRNGGVEETVVHEETGLFVEPGDVEAHAEAFLVLSRDPGLRHRMGEAGWRRAKNHFSCEHERASLVNIMEQN